MCDLYFHLRFSVLLLFIFVNLGSCLYCFQCEEVKNGDGICRSEDGVKHNTKDCPLGVCVTYYTNPYFQRMGEPGTILRSCGYSKYCEQISKQVEAVYNLTESNCTQCYTDYCNSSGMVLPSFIIFGLLAVKYCFL